MRRRPNSLRGLTAALPLVVVLGACSDEKSNGADASIDGGSRDAEADDRSLADAGDAAGGDAGAGGDDSAVDPHDAGGSAEDASTANPYNSVSAIQAYFDGKTMVMEGDALPSWPHGVNENVNFGAATQCYHKVTLSLMSGPTMGVTSDLGTLNNAPNFGDLGTCDRTTISTTLSFQTTALLFENVASDGSCFDITATFPGFAQDGRGSISSDGRTLLLELYAKDQATSHRCANGPPGSTGVVFAGSPFLGDSVQTYTLVD